MPIDENDGSLEADAGINDLNTVEQHAEAWRNDAYACDTRVMQVPPRAMIRDFIEDPNKGVAIVRRQVDNAVVGLALFKVDTGRIVWIAARPGANAGNILIRLCRRVHNRTGILPWGYVHNPIVRNAFFTAEPGMIIGENDKITWPGS